MNIMVQGYTNSTSKMLENNIHSNTYSIFLIHLVSDYMQLSYFNWNFTAVIIYYHNRSIMLSSFDGSAFVLDIQPRHRTRILALSVTFMLATAGIGKAWLFPNWLRLSGGMVKKHVNPKIG